MDQDEMEMEDPKDLDDEEEEEDMAEEDSSSDDDEEEEREEHNALERKVVELRKEASDWMRFIFADYKC